MIYKDDGDGYNNEDVDDEKNNNKQTVQSPRIWPQCLIIYFNLLVYCILFWIF